MQVRFFFGLLVAIIAGTTLPLSAQPVMRTNEKGETIIVFPDGSTQLFSEFSGTTESQQKAAAGNKYPVADIRIAPLEGSIPITEEDLRRIAERKSQIAKDAARIAQDRADEASQQYTRLEEEYRQALRRNASGSTIEQLAARLESAKQAEAEAGREAQDRQHEAPVDQRREEARARRARGSARPAAFGSPAGRNPRRARQEISALATHGSRANGAGLARLAPRH